MDSSSVLQSTNSTLAIYFFLIDILFNISFNKKLFILLVAEPATKNFSTFFPCILSFAKLDTVESSERRKYARLPEDYIFAAFGVETFSPWGTGATKICEISLRLAIATEKTRKLALSSFRTSTLSFSRKIQPVYCFHFAMGEFL